jgi:isopentenyl-diphosphate delta-isomerase
MPKIIIVDKNDQPIGVKDRTELAAGDIYRVSALWLTNTKGDILMARRALTKKNDPGVWGPAVAGTVEESEEYDDNILKEIGEEIGLKVSIADLKKGPKIHINKGPNDYFGQWYFFTIDKLAEDFIIQKDEVAEVKWFTKKELQEAISNHPTEFTKAAEQWLPHFLQ